MLDSHLVDSFKITNKSAAVIYTCTVHAIYVFANVIAHSIKCLGSLKNAKNVTEKYKTMLKN